MNLIATRRPVTEIPARAMLDLEGLGGGAFSDEYATLVDYCDGMLVAKHRGELVSLQVEPEVEIPVITYGVSNMLETNLP